MKPKGTLSPWAIHLGFTSQGVTEGKPSEKLVLGDGTADAEGSQGPPRSKGATLCTGKTIW